jgi:acyl-homoserine lactone synthase
MAVFQKEAAMQVHVVHSENQHLYQSELNQFFKLRHDIYVDEKHWREPSPDGMERDQFDTDIATYFIGIRDGEVIAGSRLIPTDFPHLLSEVFPHACNLGGVPRYQHYAEWTRGFIVKSARDQLGLKVKAASCAAIMEYCLQENITMVGGIQEMYWLPLWRRLGWTVNFVGTPLEIDNTWCVAAYFDVSRAALSSARRRAGVATSNLTHAGIYRPFHPRTALPLVAQAG